MPEEHSRPVPCTPKPGPCEAHYGAQQCVQRDSADAAPRRARDLLPSGADSGGEFRDPPVGRNARLDTGPVVGADQVGRGRERRLRPGRRPGIPLPRSGREDALLRLESPRARVVRPVHDHAEPNLPGDDGGLQRRTAGRGSASTRTEATASATSPQRRATNPAKRRAGQPSTIERPATAGLSVQLRRHASNRGCSQQLVRITELLVVTPAVDADKRAAEGRGGVRTPPTQLPYG